MLDLSRSEIRRVAALLDPLMRARGTRVSVAAEIGITSTALGEFLLGRSAMRASAEVLDRIAAHFNTTRADMLAGRARPLVAEDGAGP